MLLIYKNKILLLHYYYTIIYYYTSISLLKKDISSVGELCEHLLFVQYFFAHFQNFTKIKNFGTQIL